MVVSPAVVGTVGSYTSLHVSEVESSAADPRAEEGQRIRIVGSRTVGWGYTEASKWISIESVSQRAIDDAQSNSKT